MKRALETEETSFSMMDESRRRSAHRLSSSSPSAFYSGRKVPEAKRNPPILKDTLQATLHFPTPSLRWAFQEEPQPLSWRHIREVSEESIKFAERRKMWTDTSRERLRVWHIHALQKMLYPQRVKGGNWWIRKLGCWNDNPPLRSHDEKLRLGEVAEVIDDLRRNSAEVNGIVNKKELLIV